MIDASESSLSDKRTPAQGWRAAFPIATIIFLSPVLTELLAGIIHITNIWLLVPEMGVYGVAALLVREAVVRRRPGWGAIVVLGIAYALTEECIILQTSLTPQFFPAGTASFGWAGGVQWLYLVAMLGYESVYAVVLPIFLTSILFPDRRDTPWLGQRGLIIAIIIFILASIGVWWLWHNVGLHRYGTSTYQIPPLNIILAVIVVALLIVAALTLRLPTRTVRETTRRAWAPWPLGLITFFFSFFWWLMVAFVYVPATTFHGASPAIFIGAGIVWALLALLVVRHLAKAKNWQDRHRFALIFGAVMGSMLGGTLVILAAAPIDKLGKLVFDLIAIVLLSIQAWHMRKSRASRIAQEK